MPKITEEQQQTWDVLSKPFYASTEAEIRDRIHQDCKRYVGQPNIGTTRYSIESTVSAIMKSTNGLADFIVICDDTNNPPGCSTINCDVAYKPNRSLRMINIHLTIK